MIDDGGLIVVALCALAATLSLGAYVARRPPAPFDVELNALRGRGTSLAILFTRTGYWPVLTSLSVVVFAIDFAANGGVAFATALCGTQLLSQWTAERVKDAFKRIRPDDWIYHQELGFSYPSGHATTAAVYFGGLLIYVWHLPLTQGAHVAASAVVAVFVAGIPWSRIVLCAHYGTDVLGGLLFGAAWLCLMTVLLRHAPAAPVWRLL